VPALGHDLGVEFAVAIARGVQIHFAEIPANGFGCRAVARVSAAPALGRIFAVADLLLQLQFQERLQGLFHEILEDVFRIHGLSAATGSDLIHEQLLECLRIGVEDFGVGHEAGIPGGFGRLRFFHGAFSFPFSDVTG
jgi:hypothetical protein